MTVKIIPNEKGNPPSKLAEAELHFSAGPFRLVVTRPFATKPGFYRTQWLSGEVDRCDVTDEAKALLDDPRDSIIRVGVWSTKEAQFVGGFSR